MTDLNFFAREFSSLTFSNSNTFNVLVKYIENSYVYFMFISL